MPCRFTLHVPRRRRWWFAAAISVVLLALVFTDRPVSADPCLIASSLELIVAASQQDLGCATSEPFTTAASEQPFEHGTMLWLQEWGSISVLHGGAYESYDDLYSPDTPASAGLVPPREELQEPRQGFGEVWRKIGGPTAALGWATGPEQGYLATVQYFERGAVIQRTDGSVFALATYNHARGQWSISTFVPPESGR